MLNNRRVYHQISWPALALQNSAQKHFPEHLQDHRLLSFQQHQVTILPGIGVLTPWLANPGLRIWYSECYHRSKSSKVNMSIHFSYIYTHCIYVYIYIYCIINNNYIYTYHPPKLAYLSNPALLAPSFRKPPHAGGERTSAQSLCDHQTPSDWNSLNHRQRCNFAESYDIYWYPYLLINPILYMHCMIPYFGVYSSIWS